MNDNATFSDSAIQLGRLQVEFDCLYGTKEMLDRLTTEERTRELLRICNREGISFRAFEYLERKLITNRERHTDEASRAETRL